MIHNYFQLVSTHQYRCTMKSTPAMSKQSDGCHKEALINTGANSIRKLCVLGGLKYVFEGSALYTTFTDWLEHD